MNLTAVKEKAREIGINPKKMRKAEIIQQIQIQEDNFPCFGTMTDYCDQSECVWQEDCIKSKSL